MGGTPAAGASLPFGSKAADGSRADLLFVCFAAFGCAGFLCSRFCKYFLWLTFLLLPLLDLSMSPLMVFDAVSRKETRLFACEGLLDSVKAMALWGDLRSDKSSCVEWLKTLVTRNTSVVGSAELHGSR
jgi:hypothetical protein